MGGIRRAACLTGLCVLALLGWQYALPAQATKAERSRFEFQIVESFDSQYLGDTPGHIGRGGGLGRIIPNVALGDPVYHDKAQIGKVTRVTWDRAKESLEVEFSPEPKLRISVGESAWVPLGGSS